MIMMEERKWKVYVHENKINGKRYVGITKQDANKRWRNGNGYVGSEYFFRAINKYGWDGFEHSIILDGLSKEDAENIEIELIKKFNSNKRECGYNIQSGGNTSGTHSEETIEKIKNAISGENHYLYGKHPSESTLEKMRVINSGGKNNKAKIVVCDGNRFSCAKDCADYYDIPYSSMKQWLNGRVKMPVEWYVIGLRYEEMSMSSYIREDKQHWSRGKGIQNSGNSKAVEAFKDDISLGVFQSTSEIERKSLEIFGIQLSTSNISRVCNGKRKHHKGFVFKYKRN